MKIIKTSQDKEDKTLDCEIYVLCFRNEERQKRMYDRFETLNIKANLCCFEDNPDIIMNNIDPKNGIIATASFYNQLSIIKKFYNESDKEYGVFLENDVFLKKSLADDLKNACEHIKFLELDMLLIGYLLNMPLEKTECVMFHEDSLKNKYCTYGTYFWGSQGFILTKNQAKYFIKTYTDDYIISKERTEILSLDWVFTKRGKTALIYPPLVVEEGEIMSDSIPHILYHRQCKEFLYNSNYI